METEQIIGYSLGFSVLIVGLLFIFLLFGADGDYINRIKHFYKRFICTGFICFCAIYLLLTYLSAK